MADQKSDTIPVITSLEDFKLQQVLSVNTKQKSMSVCGHWPEEDPTTRAVIVAEKQPITEKTINSLFAKSAHLKQNFQNDIYGQFEASSCSLGELKLTTIFPATEKHILKYMEQSQYLLRETPEDYELITRPFIQAEAMNLQWVYNILEGRSESDRVVHRDPDLSNGFILVPDLKWDISDLDNLYLIAIVMRKDLQSLRDVTSNHLPLLKNIILKGKEAVKAMYGIHGNQLRFYIHYQPSFYHLHVHITNIKYESASVLIGRSHLLDDIIDNIERIDEHYYQKRVMNFVLKESDGLLKDLYKRKVEF